MKLKFFLILFVLAISSAQIQADCGCGCGCGGSGKPDRPAEKEGWRYLQKQNKRFIRDSTYVRQRAKTADSQNPAFVVLSCADSRTPPELIFYQQNKLGRIFCPRVAGNTAGDQVIDSIAFAVTTWDVNTVVVMGHDNCGAVVGALERLRINGGVVDPDNGIFNAVLIPIEKAIVAAGIDIYGPNALQESIVANVYYAAQQLIIKSTKIANALGTGQITIVGSVYSLSSGKAEEIFVWGNNV